MVYNYLLIIFYLMFFTAYYSSRMPTHSDPPSNGHTCYYIRNPSILLQSGKQWGNVCICERKKKEWRINKSFITIKCISILILFKNFKWVISISKTTSLSILMCVEGVGDHAVKLLKTRVLSEHHGALPENIRKSCQQDAPWCPFISSFTILNGC